MSRESTHLPQEKAAERAADLARGRRAAAGWVNNAALFRDLSLHTPRREPHRPRARPGGTGLTPLATGQRVANLASERGDPSPAMPVP